MAFLNSYMYHHTTVRAFCLFLKNTLLIYTMRYPVPAEPYIS